VVLAPRPMRVAAAAESTVERPVPHAVATGLDVLASQEFAPLRGRRVGLVTNQTGQSRDGSTIDLLSSAKGMTLVALFSPEHGIRGALDDKVSSSRDE